MDFIYEKQITFLKGCKQSGKVSRFVKNRTGCYFHINTHLICYDMCKSGLAKSWRTMEKNMVKSFSSHLRCLDIDIKVGNDLSLTSEIPKFLRPYHSVDVFVAAYVPWIEISHNLTLPEQI